MDADKSECKGIRVINNILASWNFKTLLKPGRRITSNRTFAN
jgi:hypothetical protein